MSGSIASSKEYEQSSAIRADLALRNWYAAVGCPNPGEMTWVDYDNMVAAVKQSSQNWPRQHRFQYIHPIELQDNHHSSAKSYPVPINYSDSGGNGAPLIAVGGLINVVQRFDFMAIDSLTKLRLISVDLAGRGRSGWMMEQSDYALDTYVELLRQLLGFLELDRCSLLGSSLGGSVALRFAAKYPKLVERIVLNDSGPCIPQERRARRAIAVGRYYVFRSLQDLLRRTGAATRPVGPVPDAVLLHNFHHKTRWSQREGGRIYRHDPRATLAYRIESAHSLNLWEEWNQLSCPVLLIHGTKSDATSSETIDQMRRHEQFSVIHVHGAGHTPSLAASGLTQIIVDWMVTDKPFSNDLDFHFSYEPKRLFYPDVQQN